MGRGGEWWATGLQFSGPVVSILPLLLYPNPFPIQGRRGGRWESHYSDIVVPANLVPEVTASVDGAPPAIGAGSF